MSRLYDRDGTFNIEVLGDKILDFLMLPFTFLSWFGKQSIKAREEIVFYFLLMFMFVMFLLWKTII